MEIFDYINNKNKILNDKWHRNFCNIWLNGFDINFFFKISNKTVLQWEKWAGDTNRQFQMKKLSSNQTQNKNLASPVGNEL